MVTFEKQEDGLENVKFEATKGDRKVSLHYNPCLHDGPLEILVESEGGHMKFTLDYRQFVEFTKYTQLINE